MTNLDGSDTIGLLRSTRLLPVVTIAEADAAVPLAAALAAGGLPVIEITLRTPAANDAIRRIASELPTSVVGAGTVTSAADAAAAVAAGARFLVSPGFGDDVVDAARSLGVPVLPGIATATELQRAVRAGVTTVKVFPASTVGGPGFVAAVAAVWPDVEFVPTGGIDASTVREYLAQPRVLAVGGSWMVPSDAVATGDWSAVTAAAASAVRAIGDPR